MADYTAARRMMVDGRIRTADVTDLRIIAAFQETPRERFVAPAAAALAYLDLDAPVDDPADPNVRRLLKPMVLAKLIQTAQVRASDRVLVVGAATGYAAAILGRLAASVVALEEDDALLARGVRVCAELGLSNIETVRGPLTAGWPAGAPYDVILIDGCVEVSPEPLLRQLADGGRLVCVHGRTPATKAMLYVASAGHVSGRPVFDASAPALPGFAQAPAFVF
ncbi:MAG: protein-L-isoaspartate O-methyltransferase [Pseudorhodoplanes sp.]|nr:protein-L-isoaspartate O-methyltransferase [Pseudorhodoplanes sp.]